MSQRSGKTWRMVETAVEAAKRGERVVGVHPKGSPPTGDALEALTAAGVVLAEVTP